MKLRIGVIAILCIGLCCTFSSLGNQVYAQEKLKVLNPMGTPPPIQAKKMAPRLTTLDGKTLYLINTGFVNTNRLMDEFMAYFKENYPKTNLVLSRAGMDNINQQVLDEIKEKADGVIVALGH